MLYVGLLKGDLGGIFKDGLMGMSDAGKIGAKIWYNQK